MPISETDKILKSMFREFRGIRMELHELNRNIQFLATMTSDLPNQAKSEMLEIINRDDKKETDIHEQ